MKLCLSILIIYVLTFTEVINLQVEAVSTSYSRVNYNSKKNSPKHHTQTQINHLDSNELNESDKRDLLEARTLRSLKKGFNAWAGKRSNGNWLLNEHINDLRDTPENLKFYNFMAKNGLFELTSE